MKAESVQLTSLLEHLKKDEAAKSHNISLSGRGEKLIALHRIAMDFGMAAAERAMAQMDQSPTLETSAGQTEQIVEPTFLQAG